MDYGKLALKRIEELSDYIRLKGKSEEKKDYSVSAGTGSFSLAKGEKSGKVVRVLLDDDGDLKIKFFVSVSGSDCLVEGTLDGQKLVNENVSGTADIVRICSAVEKGIHEIGLEITAGATLAVNSLSITAEGNIDRTCDKIFIDADKNGTLFLENNLSRVAVCKFVNGKKAELYAFYGVSYARIKKFSTKFYLFVVTETGQAAVVKIAEDGSDVGYCYVTDGAVCLDGAESEDGNITLFAGKNNTTEIFVFDVTSGEVRACSSFEGGADEISVTKLGHGYALVTRNDDSVYLSVSEGTSADVLKEKFTVSISES